MGAALRQHGIVAPLVRPSSWHQSDQGWYQSERGENEGIGEREESTSSSSLSKSDERCVVRQKNNQNNELIKEQKETMGTE